MSSPEFKVMDSAVFDPEAVDGKQYMMNHDLQGCFCLQIPSVLQQGRGTITVSETGRAEYVVATTGSGPYLKYVLGIKLFNLPLLYDHTYYVHLHGFVLKDGTPVADQEVEVRTAKEPVADDTHPYSNQVALRAARESIVLLKNEGNVLPFPANSTVNFFGKGVHQFRIGTIGAGRITPRFQISLVRGIRDYASFQLNEHLVSFYRNGKDDVPSDELIQDALRMSDTAVVVISRGTSENVDNLAAKGEFYLSDAEDALVRFVTRTFSHTVAVINTGYPIDVSWIEHYQVDAAVWTGLGGMYGGQALAEVLSGTVAPSGRLPDTWSNTYQEIPAAYNFYLPEEGGPRLSGFSEEWINTWYTEGMYVGYRYFSTFRKPVAYPFGHGLSYTTFSTTVKAVEQDIEASYDQPLMTARFLITNTGHIPGQQVIQVYASFSASDPEEPALRLVGFAKTQLLAPGGTQELAVAMNAERFCVYNDEQASWILQAGQVEIYLGESSDRLQAIASIEMTDSRVMKQIRRVLKAPVDVPYLTTGNSGSCVRKEMLTGKTHLSPQKEYHFWAETDPVGGSTGSQQERETPITLIKSCVARKHWSSLFAR